MAHTYRNHHFHLIWSTKGRKNIIDKGYKTRLYSYMGGIIRANNGVLLEIGGMPNHVHLLISLSSLDKYSECIRKIKGGSSLWVNQELSLPIKFAWQEGYGSFCVSYSQLEIVRKYIQNQEAHHHKQTFEQEYLNFLKVHGIEYDEKYVFD
jgi:putative transposase